MSSATDQAGDPALWGVAGGVATLHWTSGQGMIQAREEMRAETIKEETEGSGQMRLNVKGKDQPGNEYTTKGGSLGRAKRS